VYVRACMCMCAHRLMSRNPQPPPPSRGFAHLLMHECLAHDTRGAQEVTSLTSFCWGYKRINAFKIYIYIYIYLHSGHHGNKPNIHSACLHWPLQLSTAICPFTSEQHTDVIQESSQSGSFPFLYMFVKHFLHFVSLYLLFCS